MSELCLWMVVIGVTLLVATGLWVAVAVILEETVRWYVPCPLGVVLALLLTGVGLSIIGLVIALWCEALA